MAVGSGREKEEVGVREGGNQPERGLLQYTGPVTLFLDKPVFLARIQYRPRSFSSTVYLFQLASARKALSKCILERATSVCNKGTAYGILNRSSVSFELPSKVYFNRPGYKW